jgi:hypothetical protein
LLDKIHIKKSRSYNYIGHKQRAHKSNIWIKNYTHEANFRVLLVFKN